MPLGHIHIQHERPVGARIPPNGVVPMWHIRRHRPGCARMALPLQHVTTSMTRWSQVGTTWHLMCFASFGTSWYLMCSHNFSYCLHLALIGFMVIRLHHKNRTIYPILVGRGTQAQNAYYVLCTYMECSYVAFHR